MYALFSRTHGHALRRTYRYAFVSAIKCTRGLLYAQKHPGEINLATDCWTAPNHRAFLALYAFYDHDGKHEVLLLDMKEVPDAHTGQRLGREIELILNDFGIAQKVSTTQ